MIFQPNIAFPLYVTPQAGEPTTTIFLVSSPSGPGHYDSAVPYSCVQMPKDKLEPVRCSCGTNSKKGQSSCTQKPHYATRCKCYKRSLACTTLCRCKNCGIPNGQRQKQGVTRRRAHAMQLDIPNSIRFALDRGEAISKRIWSDFETIICDPL